jgi:crotonobetainyl-CoA:carnitine CoA-transferase CaiB-like acyl-CoA transferase
LLDGIRALDLTDEKGFFCGKILANLGVGVIKVERPGGDRTRMLGPFCDGEVNPEKSLCWVAYNGGKKSITLDITGERGKHYFRELVIGADIIIESFPPGKLESLGLGYNDLSKINPRLILVSITPYGSTGPYKDLKASDITLVAMSGLMGLTGDEDRAPLKLCLEQSYCLAGTHATIGLLYALYERNISGLGQHIDISTYECVVLANYREPMMWEWEKRIASRKGDRLFRGKGTTKQVWECKDGYVTWNLIDNPGMIKNLVVSMDKEGMAGTLKSIDWDKLAITGLSTEEIMPIEEQISAFFLKHTKKELEKISIQRNLTLSVINDLCDVMESDQLIQREFWCDQEYPEFGTSIKVPGFLFLSEEAPSMVRSKAPRIGEHNEQIYGIELGLSKGDMAELKKAKVI